MWRPHQSGSKFPDLCLSLCSITVRSSRCHFLIGTFKATWIHVSHPFSLTYDLEKHSLITFEVRPVFHIRKSWKFWSCLVHEFLSSASSFLEPRVFWILTFTIWFYFLIFALFPILHFGLIVWKSAKIFVVVCLRQGVSFSQVYGNCPQSVSGWSQAFSSVFLLDSLADIE